jgi:hypothetical protein
MAHSAYGIWSALIILISSAFSSCSPAPHPAEATVRSFLERYFSTWSKKDMDGYAACFHPQARVSYIQNGAPQTQGVTDFLHGQTMSHATAREPMIEVPLEMRILMDDRAAQAYVRWRLTQGSRVVTGTDCFTLIQKPQGGWAIISLVFYND